LQQKPFWHQGYRNAASNLENDRSGCHLLSAAGGNPLLARARTVENQLFLVTSTYSTMEDWMKSGVIDRRGDWLVQGCVD